jgi:hypothetical protein
MAHAREVASCFITGTIIASVILREELFYLIEIELLPGHKPFLLQR